ncbi:MAG: hypothetical protein K9G76_07855 [Bacteroidales bacterium]|nr:hypothetical protein [Bacteroidales bacterium]MCF8404765.1 hypothetical protein [Bacteroidales bacterium]
MKSKILNSPVRNILMGILVTIMVVSFTSCAKKIVFLKSIVVPAAEGYVKVKTDNNNNYVIQIHLSNLAEIERLQPPKKTYVIWMLTDQQTNENLGRVSTSSNLNATFETVSSFKPTKIFISAEENEEAQYPGNTIVLTTDRFWD